MPYKASGNYVMVKRGGRWVQLKKHPNPDAARRHARALDAHVKHK